MAIGEKLDIPEFKASSAGTRAVIAHPIHPEAALVLRRLGGDPTDFSARQLTTQIASNADLVLTMTRAHRDAVLELAPHRLHRTFTLPEAALLASAPEARNVADLADLRSRSDTRTLTDIPDPIGKDAEVFNRIGLRLSRLLDPVLEFCRHE